MTMLKIGAFIPARISSQRLREKNIRMLGNKPLLFWTIDALQQADVFQSITVSTDSDKIAQLVLDNYSGDEVQILMRPDELKAYDASMYDLMGHYLENSDVDIFGAFMPTYPFRKVETLIEIDTFLRTRQPWRVSSYTRQPRATTSYFYPVEQGVKCLFEPMRPLFCQVEEAAYKYWHRNVFLGNWKNFNLTRFERHLNIYIDEHEGVDIDYEEDFALAEQIASGKRMVPRPVREHRFGDWIVTVPSGVDAEQFIGFVGQERLEDTTQPLLVLENVQHGHARFLQRLEVLGRSYYAGSQAMRYLYGTDGKVFQSQKLPVEYRTSPHYQLLRLKDSPYHVSSYNVGDDSHGHNTGIFSDVSSTERESCGKYHAGPDIIPWIRVIFLEDIEKQDFHVPPYRLV
jgi:CMP-N-acetylneuraminic acid synthetase